MSTPLLRLLRYVTDDALADSVAGDLEEQHWRRATQSRAGATLWFWQAFIAILGFAVVRRLRDALASCWFPDVGFRRSSGEIRRSLRSLRRAPWYAGTVIGVIALGMSLATTVFVIVDGVLFKPLPYPQADRLFVVYPEFTDLASSKSGRGASAVDVANWAASSPGALVTGFSAANWTDFGQDVNEPVVGFAQIQPNFFDVIGVHPLFGGFTASDFDHRDALQPVIMTYEVWQGRFQGDSQVVGRAVVLDPSRGSGYRIVGVMPRGFMFPSDRATIGLIAPYVIDPDIAANPRRRLFPTVLVRVAAETTTAQLRTQIEVGMAATARAYPAIGPKPVNASPTFWRSQGPFNRADVRPLRADLGHRDRPLFLAVFWAALVLVALGAVNVSGLMAARALDRTREFSMRRALGAARRRIARLVVVEALVLMGVGAAFGVLLSVIFLPLVLRLLPDERVLLTIPTTGGRAVGFATVLIGAVIVMTTIWPVRRALRAGVGPIGDGGRASDRVRSGGRFMVVASQIAGALVLTIGGALLVGSMLRVYANTRPVRTAGVTVIETQLFGPGGVMGASPERTARVRAVVERLQQVPGITAVAANASELLRGGDWPPAFDPPPGAPNPTLVAYTQAVTADFYRLIELPIVAGRLPTDAELASDARVIVVSEAVARGFWPVGTAVGRTLMNGDKSLFTVVGVVRDVRWQSWDQESPEIYGPYAWLGRGPFPTFFLRSDQETGRITAQALDTIRQADPFMRPMQTATLDELFFDSVRPRRFQAWLFGVFASAAMVVIGVGVLGLIAMSTARRTREIGIRMALGSTSERVVGLLLREQFVAVVAGVIAGGAISAWAVTFVKAYVYQLTVYDPRVWAIAIALILATAATGALIPSLRASRVDPVTALRVE